MARYYVNRNAQEESGDHEVHTSTCFWLPKPENRIDLGEHSSCSSAVKKAKEYYSKSNGCKTCSTACHTS